MTTMVKFGTRAGGELEGALTEPPGSGKAGALIVVHEWHGLNEIMKLHGQQFADAGFLTLVPDLFHGRVAQSDDEAAKLLGSFDFKNALAEIGDAVAYLRAHPRCNGKVAVAGFCLGGALTLAAARTVPELAAAVPFYGLPRMPADDLADAKAPICGHYARVDAWADPAIAQEIQAKVRARGGHMELYVYDAEHAFMRSTDAARYEPKSAALAWQRTLAFLHQHLG